MVCSSCRNRAAATKPARWMRDYRKVIASRPDTILRSAAFGLQNTRSPPAVEARAAYARLKAKERADATLSAQEQIDVRQLSLFALNGEEP